MLPQYSGIGDDLFEAFFADDEPVKKKPAPVTVEATSAAAPVEPPKPAVKKTSTKKTSTKKTASKKTTTAAPPKPTESAEKEKEKPQFPHTPALLELAQQTTADKDTAEKTGESTEKNVDSTEKVFFFLYFLIEENVFFIFLLQIITFRLKQTKWKTQKINWLKTWTAKKVETT